MSKKSWHITRRTALRGLGVSCALPFLESMTSDVQAAAAKGNVAKRLCCIYTPNGVSLPPEKNKDFKDWHWFPHNTGKDFKFTKVLESLETVRKQVTIVGGLSHPKSRNLLGHAAGDTFLTGGDIGGAKYNQSVSIDQLAVTKLSKETRYPFLALSCDGGIGYKSRVSTMSFNLNGQAVPTQYVPRQIFERYFSGADAQSKDERRKKLMENKKIVDLVLGDAKSLNLKLGKRDQVKLDDYLTSLSSVEDQIKRSEDWLDKPFKAVDSDFTNLDIDQKVPGEYIRTMYDLMALAYETDITRVMTYMVAREDGIGFGDKFPSIMFGFKGHHSVSHDKGDGAYKRWAQYDQFQAQQLSYFLNKLNSIEDENGKILDSSMVMFGSACSTTHNARNYPLVLAGGANMGLKHGRFLKYDEKTPLSNMFVSMLEGLDVKAHKFADSTGDLKDLYRDV